VQEDGREAIPEKEARRPQVSEPVFCDAKAVCKALDISKSTVSKYRLRKHNPMPSHRLGGDGALRFILADVLAWSRGEPPQPAQPEEPQPTAQRRQRDYKSKPVKKGLELLYSNGLTDAPLLRR
jgi:predicted DNA-binding transcriptional regulator AlpA